MKAQYIQRKNHVSKGGHAVSPHAEHVILQAARSHIPKAIASGYSTHGEGDRHKVRIAAINALKAEGLKVLIGPAGKERELPLTDRHVKTYRWYSEQLSKGALPNQKEMAAQGITAEDLHEIATIIRKGVHPALQNLAHSNDRGVRSKDIHRMRLLRKAHDAMLPMMELGADDMKESHASGTAGK